VSRALKVSAESTNSEEFAEAVPLPLAEVGVVVRWVLRGGRGQPPSGASHVSTSTPRSAATHRSARSGAGSNAASARALADDDDDNGGGCPAVAAVAGAGSPPPDGWPLPAPLSERWRCHEGFAARSCEEGAACAAGPPPGRCGDGGGSGG
jgi:hypothetical protein